MKGDRKVGYETRVKQNVQLRRHSLMWGTAGEEEVGASGDTRGMQQL